MSSQIFLFTGVNAFELRAERRRWESSFKAKHGEENLTRIDGCAIIFHELLDAVSSAPFISTRRLIILNGIPRMEQQQCALLLQYIHPCTLLLICDPNPDKRLTATKAFLKVAEVKAFPPLSQRKLVLWVVACCHSYGARMSERMAERLTVVVGGDQMLLAVEIEKLATYAYGRDIVDADIDALVMLSAEQAGWKMMDLLGEGHSDRALLFANETIQKGESPEALWNMLLWIVSQIVCVNAALRDGKTTPVAVCKSVGVKPQTARTLIPMVRALPPEQLLAAVRAFVFADTKLKTGGFRSSAESPEEMLTIIDTCILQFAR